MTVQVKSPQQRVHEIGLIGRIAHNLAKYRCYTNSTYTPDEFRAGVRSYMEKRKVEAEQIDEWMEYAEAQADDEVMFFVTRGRFAESNGGSSIAICALIGPVLDVLGYEED
jgi:hypothetical protein